MILKGWRTLLANLIVGLGGYLQSGSAHQVIPPEYLPLVMMLMNFALRYITSTPIAQPSAPAAPPA